MAEVKIPKIESNSHKHRKAVQKREKLESVINKEKIVSTKKPISRRLTDKFLETDIKEAREYFLSDILIPGIKDAALDVMSMLLTGEGYERRKRSSRRGRDRERVSYRSSYERGRSSRRSRDRDRGRRYDGDIDDDNISYRDIVLKDRTDAEEIVYKLHDRIDANGEATVAELFDLLDISVPFTDNDYGWTRKGQIDYKRVNGGWLIDVDEARYLG